MTATVTHLPVSSPDPFTDEAAWSAWWLARWESIVRPAVPALGPSS